MWIKNTTSEGGKEIAVKNKHIITSLLAVLLVIVLIVGGGITIYKYEDKIKILNALADTNMKESSLSTLEKKDITTCKDTQCIQQVATAKAYYGGDSDNFCDKLPAAEQEMCRNQFYKEKAISTQNAIWCSKISGDMRDYCYYTLYVMTNNSKLCGYIQSEEYKALCNI